MNFQSLHWGRELTDRALGQESADLFVSVDLVFSALDRLKEAELLSKGEDVELLCRSLAQEGVIYYVSGKVANDASASFFISSIGQRILKQTTRAKDCFSEALDLSKTLQGNINLHSKDW